MVMMMSCPNYDREDGLDTVLEVPIPEDMFVSSYTKTSSIRSWGKNMKSWMRSHRSTSPQHHDTFRTHRSSALLLLNVLGAPLIHLPVPYNVLINPHIKDHPSETSMAKYIVQQYIASTGGDDALNGIHSMYAMGKLKMAAYDVSNKKDLKVKANRQLCGGGGDVGTFVLWQRKPDLWCLELVLSGYKIGAGSDGKVAWRQTPWHSAHAARCPTRPLRRALQGLDPRTTASLFSKSTCTGEEAINEEDCFVLKLKEEQSALRARNCKNVEIISHAILGYFSQKTGLLVKLEDSHHLRIATTEDDNIYCKTTMESMIQDYHIVDGINIAHSGSTVVSLIMSRNVEGVSVIHSRTRMEEIWTIEEVDFNVKGLSNDFFLPPSDLQKEQDLCSSATSYENIPFTTQALMSKISSSKVVAIDVEDLDSTDKDSYEEGFKNEEEFF